MSDLAIILVHYRTPELLAEAVRALRSDLETSGLRAEIVVVDNGSEPVDRSAWDGLALRRIDPGANLGYAGGVRCGVEATSAARIIAMNPDVLVAPGCLASLHAELERGTAAAGPQFYWDHDQRVFLPPTESRSVPAELRAALARRFPAAPLLSGAARKAWRRHARRHWQATEPFASSSLSGALIAFRRDAWAKVGPFDEVFRLYFEETDWLLRLRAAGLASRFVPAAHAVHLYAQSSVREPSATAWFAEAEKIFRRRHFGAAVAKLLDSLTAAAKPPRRAAGRAPDVAPAASAALALPGLFAAGDTAWVEMALAAGGFPAAGERLARPTPDWQMPEEIWRRLPPGELWIRAIDARGREWAPVHLVRDDTAQAR